jgi:Nif-specific regulatory protein
MPLPRLPVLDYRFLPISAPFMPDRSPVSLSPSVLEHIGAEPATARAAVELLSVANRASGSESWLGAALAPMPRALGADFLAVAVPDEGQWTAIAEAGKRRPLPVELLFDALDRDAWQASEGWLAAAASAQRTDNTALVAHFATDHPTPAMCASFAALAKLLGQAMDEVHQRQLQARRLERLVAILEIAGNWNKTHEMEPLLVQMAEAATRLLEADRASIFLWDKPNKTLVGRPALGVEGGELRIPDNAGVVGRVLQTGLTERVDLAKNQELIDHRVDAQLKYRTRTLLCAPLRGSSGELFGVFEMINKRQGNFTDDDEATLVELANQAAITLENTQQRTELLASRRQISEQAASGIRLIGDSPAMAALRSTIGRVAATDLAVLVLGENGTGKEVVSQSIHYLSPRREQPFIAVNCAAISETLLESELFGHEKGAFTDAHAARPGKFELAAGGTIFLDEIGDLSPAGQAKLLRVLEEKVVVRVGGSKTIHTDARVIAATNQNLAEMVRHKKFRQDLYFRLNVVTIDLPPLRDRPEDILVLAEFFLVEFSKKARRKPPRIDAEARKRLQSHTWPGNVRELRNLTERLAYLSAGDTIEPTDLSFILPPGDDSPEVDANLPLAEATDRFQIEHIRRAIERSGSNMSDAAERLGLHRSNLYRKMRQLGLDVQDL